MDFVDWVHTVPKHVDWNQYLWDLSQIVEREESAFYRVSRFPKGMRPGSRLFIVWDGFVRGWLEVEALVISKGFTCTSSGDEMPPGNYIQRHGQFHSKTPHVRMKGFRGVQKYNVEHGLTPSMWRRQHKGT